MNRAQPGLYCRAMKDAIHFEELLDYAEFETRRWRDWFERYPAALAVKTEVATAGNAMTLVFHIAFVEQYYVAILMEEPRPDYKTMKYGSIEELFAIFDESQNRLRHFLKTAKKADWDKPVDLGSRGEFTVPPVTKRKCFAHVLLHGTRHWAQLATELRASGYKQDWQHDFLFTEAMR